MNDIKRERCEVNDGDIRHVINVWSFADAVRLVSATGGKIGLLHTQNKNNEHMFTSRFLLVFGALIERKLHRASA